MKVIEALRATVGFDVPENMALKALIDVDLSADADYTKSLEASIDSAAISVLVAMKSVDSISEGDFSVKFNHEQANKTITYLSSKSGSTNSGSSAFSSVNDQIIDRSDIW